jgi:endonuclease YncB( thermonuclease family)
MMCRSRWATQRICVVLVALALWSATPLAQQVFTGKVVGITDGDTISVMRAGLAVRVRLYFEHRAWPSASSEARISDSVLC